MLKTSFHFEFLIDFGYKIDYDITTAKKETSSYIDLIKRPCGWCKQGNRYNEYTLEHLSAKLRRWKHRYQ